MMMGINNNHSQNKYEDRDKGEKKWWKGELALM